MSEETKNTTTTNTETNNNDDTTTPNNDDDDTPPPSPFSIPIHTLIESLQKSHGLLQNDHTQYRKYCTRRLSRLRHAKDVKSDLTHSSTGGKGSKHAFTPKKHVPEDAVQHENFILCKLLLAERAWSHAMEKKAEYDEAGGGGRGGGEDGIAKGKLRQIYLKKLRKAVKYANELEEMVNVAGDDGMKVEAKAYGCWMRGNLSLETGDWQTACTEYNSALTICRALGSGSGSGDASSLETRDYFTNRAEHVIEPVLRYCRYELTEGGMSESQIETLLSTSTTTNNNNNDPTFQLQSKLTSLQNATLQNQAKTQFTTLTFRNTTIPISNQSLRMALLKISSLQKKDQKTKNFVNLLSAHDDALVIAQKDWKELEDLKSGPAVNQKKREVKLLCQYVKWKKLKLLMERNEELVNDLRKEKRMKQSLKRLEEIAHLYDALLQDARTIADMGMDLGWLEEEEEGGGVVEEDEFLLEANAHVLRFRALRCYYMGRMYAESVEKEFEKATALFDHAVGLASRAAEELSACQDVEEELVESMVELEKEITGAKCRVEAEAYLMKVGALGEASGRSLLRRLDDFDSGGEGYHLADVPPALEYVPCKPTFFDIALNHIGEMPEEELQKHIDEYHSNAGKGGILGWFRRGG